MSLLEGEPASAAPHEATERARQPRAVTVYGFSRWEKDGVALKSRLVRER